MIIKNFLAISIAFLSGIAFGLLTCINHIYIFGLWFFLPIVWLAFANRWIALVFICAFYFSVSWEIVPDTFIYCGWAWKTALLASVMWAAAGVVPCVPWLLCFPRHKNRLSPLLLGLTALLFLLTVPPFGVICWGNPLTSAGLIYPGMRWFGLALCFTFICSVAISIYIVQYRKIALILCALLCAIAVYAHLKPPSAPPLPANWVTVNTNAHLVNANRYLVHLIQEQIRAGKQVIILPENTANLHAIRHNYLWQGLIKTLEQAHVTLVEGAFADEADSNLSAWAIFDKKHQEGVLIIEQGEIQFYEARQPLPIVSWRPFGPQRVSAHWWETGVYSVQNHKVGVFLCFEDFLPWLMIMTGTAHPDVLLSLANHWWNMPTAIHKQLLIFEIWGRLLNVPVMMAENL